MKTKYVNPFTDFGFKKIFGEEASKPMLLDFLNCLLPEIHIIDLSFKDKEKLGKTDADRKAIYDIYCESKQGEKIIIELQKAKQNYFKDRTIYYSTFPIKEQAETGDWNYELKAVYCIGILDFTFDEKIKSSESEVIHTVQLKNQNNQIFYNKLKFVYLEMPNFVKNEQELVTRLDKWLYFIKHLENFETIPEIFKDSIFIKAFETAEIAKYSQAELENYEYSLKIFRDNKAVYEYAINTAFDEGVLKVAKSLKVEQVNIDFIVKVTGLTKEDIDKL
ncbi:MAG: Rpn family recombination-promoting nuclease/putative transposase [Sphingobacteriales bacterium]|jgi:predicted transposase/invertase (TIGR01784 family)|nr:MAG: Rpn family recombination-promoting nuclease/putative transposase [Sphingobacteriales bacterium]TAF47397.1 MAG: Rpn family recombination-promoting nuclease/putative transposase [Sphingobacteriales bacterium]